MTTENTLILRHQFEWWHIHGGTDDFLSHCADRPGFVDCCGLFICQKGNGDIILDGTPFHLVPHSICIAFPYTTLQVKRKSPDFEGLLIGIDTATFFALSVPSGASLFLFVKGHPYLQLGAENADKLMSYCDLLIQNRQQPPNTVMEQIHYHLVMAICFTIISFYQSDSLPELRTVDRFDIIFRNFLLSLEQNAPSHHDVPFFASEACLTPRYFSNIIRQKSGKTAYWWIQSTLINMAKRLLSSSTFTIAEISDRLNFSNQSFFCRFFRENTGSTPREYRRTFKPTTG